jgi:hypothetical protein
VHRLPASVADQEDAIVQAVGVGVGDIGIGALDSPREVGADEQIEDPVNAVGRDAPPFGFGDRFGDIIGRGRLGEPGERVEHRRAHPSPLLALAGQPVLGRGAQRFAFMHMMLVFIDLRHGQ